MENILCFLEAKKVLSLSTVSKKIKQSVVSHWDLRLAHQIIEIESAKTVNAQELSKRIPLLYEGGFFSPYLKMLDRILF